MPKRTKKPVVEKMILRLPDFDHAKGSALNSLRSPRSRRNYKFAMEQFIILRREWPPLLQVLWRRQRPTGHEQTALKFREIKPAAQGSDYSEMKADRH